MMGGVRSLQLLGQRSGMHGAVRKEAQATSREMGSCHLQGNGTLHSLTKMGQDCIKKYLALSSVLPENNHLQDPILVLWPRKHYFCFLVLWL